MGISVSVVESWCYQVPGLLADKVRFDGDTILYPHANRARRKNEFRIRSIGYHSSMA